MTKKHYEAIAATIKRAHFDTLAPSFGGDADDIARAAGIEFLARRLSALFASENPKFQAHRFLKSCGF